MNLYKDYKLQPSIRLEAILFEIIFQKASWSAISPKCKHDGDH